LSIEKKAKMTFTITDDCKETGYILRDGTLLVMKSDYPDGESLHLDHSAVAVLYDRELLRPSVQFMRDTGAIRLSALSNTTNIEYIEEHGITDPQLSAINKCACIQGLQPHRIIYDKLDSKGKVKDSGDIKSNPYRDEPCSSLIRKFMIETL